jgi:SWI/SNF-related matrix-associated actin-dependent regulator of chromatin subfamily A member 5
VEDTFGYVLLTFVRTTGANTHAEYSRIQARIQEGEAKRAKRSNLEALLSAKIASVRYPMQELELAYPTTKGKVYSEEEDRYLLVRLNHYGMRAEDVYERIKRDVTEFPVFRFDWFFKSRSPQELQRRCNTLLAMIEKEAEQDARVADESKPKTTASRGKVDISCFCCLPCADGCIQKRAADDNGKEEKPTGTVAGGSRSRPQKKKKA